MATPINRDAANKLLDDDMQIGFICSRPLKGRSPLVVPGEKKFILRTCEGDFLVSREEFEIKIYHNSYTNEPDIEIVFKDKSLQNYYNATRNTDSI